VGGDCPHADISVQKLHQDIPRHDVSIVTAKISVSTLDFSCPFDWKALDAPVMHVSPKKFKIFKYR